MTSLLLQLHGDKLRTVAYFSSKIDPVTAGLPRCLRAVAAAEKALVASRDIVGYAPLTLLVPHAVSTILLEKKTSHLSAARYLRYHTCLLNVPNVEVKRCNTLNPASLLPLPDDGDPRDCTAVLEMTSTPRPDLTDTTLSNPDMISYVGSACRDPLTSINQVGFSDVSDTLHRRQSWLLSLKRANWLLVNLYPFSQIPGMLLVLSMILVPSGNIVVPSNLMVSQF